VVGVFFGISSVSDFVENGGSGIAGVTLFLRVDMRTSFPVFLGIPCRRYE
jgi:hypothetical protein